jgi:hypothetical protein
LVSAQVTKIYDMFDQGAQWMSKQDQIHYQQTLSEANQRLTRDSGPVTCLSMTFLNDEERRKHFLEKLREKLKDPDFRKIDGFPVGSDEFAYQDER